MNFSPFPNLNTERLQLRKLTLKDDKDILFLRSDQRILEFIDIPKAEHVQDAIDYINKMNTGIFNNEFILWGITLKSLNTIIGTICLWNFNTEKNVAEIGYVLHPDYQGQGLMQDAVKEILNYGFKTLKLNKIKAAVHSKNIKSIALLKRYDFTFSHDAENLALYILDTNLFSTK